MKQAQSTILAVGAAGKFAGLVLPALAQRGAKVRGLIRRASDAERVRAHGATDVAVGDLEDRAPAFLTATPSQGLRLLKRRCVYTYSLLRRSRRNGR
jgi:nucleoside-diphosphate-sugar epimerase